MWPCIYHISCFKTLFDDIRKYFKPSSTFFSINSSTGIVVHRTKNDENCKKCPPPFNTTSKVADGPPGYPRKFFELLSVASRLQKSNSKTFEPELRIIEHVKIQKNTFFPKSVPPPFKFVKFENYLKCEGNKWFEQSQPLSKNFHSGGGGGGVAEKSTGQKKNTRMFLEVFSDLFFVVKFFLIKVALL